MLQHNTADNVGGGLSQYGRSLAWFTDASIVTGNSALIGGGGMSCSASSSMRITQDTVIFGNKAQLGGGLTLLDSCKVSDTD